MFDFCVVNVIFIILFAWFCCTCYCNIVNNVKTAEEINMIPLKLCLIGLIYNSDSICHLCLKQKWMSIEVVLIFASSFVISVCVFLKSTRQCGAILSSEQSWGHGTWPHAACVLKSVHSCQTLNLLLTHAALFSTATSLVRSPVKFKFWLESKICVFVDRMIPINICPAFFVCLFYKLLKRVALKNISDKSQPLNGVPGSTHWYFQLL